MFSINWSALPNCLGSNKICLHSIIVFTLTYSVFQCVSRGHDEFIENIFLSHVL